MKILISGSSGFIGYHLSNFLLNKGYNVLGLDNHIITIQKNLLVIMIVKLILLPEHLLIDILVLSLLD